MYLQHRRKITQNELLKSSHRELTTQRITNCTYNKIRMHAYRTIVDVTEITGSRSRYPKVFSIDRARTPIGRRSGLTVTATRSTLLSPSETARHSITRWHSDIGDAFLQLTLILPRKCHYDTDNAPPDQE